MLSKETRVNYRMMPRESIDDVEARLSIPRLLPVPSMFDGHVTTQATVRSGRFSRGWREVIMDRC